MKYDPHRHHRRSIRLKGYDYSSPGVYFVTICTYQRECLFGKIVDGEMQLNHLGQLVDAYWQRLPQHFLNVVLDAFVVMPNHLHGIVILNPIDQGAGSRRGAAFGQRTGDISPDLLPNAAPSNSQTPNDPGGELRPRKSTGSEPGAASGREMEGNCPDPLPDATPLQNPTISEPGGASGQKLGDMILNFKSVTTRRINHLRRVNGVPVWQRNYYDKIIRDERALENIRAYIQANPLAWEVDPLHPARLSG